VWVGRKMTFLTFYGGVGEICRNGNFGEKLCKCEKMDAEQRRKIALKLSGEYCKYCKQEWAESWFKVKDKKYISMVSLLGKNSLDLRKEDDVFKLFTLALNWNSRKYGRFDRGLNLFKKLDDAGILNEIFLGKLRWENWERKKQNTNVESKVVLSYFYLRERWNEVYQRLMGLGSSTSVENFIEELHEMFKGGETTPLKVKIFFILREMKSQEILEIDDRFCCVPDNNVRKIMYIIGLTDVKWSLSPNLEVMKEISEEISQLFNRDGYQLHDMPLFWFYMTQCFCTSKCLIYNECTKKFIKSEGKSKKNIR